METMATQEAANMLSIYSATLRGWARAGRIGKKQGAGYRFPVHMIVALSPPPRENESTNRARAISARIDDIDNWLPPTASAAIVRSVESHKEVEHPDAPGYIVEIKGGSVRGRDMPRDFGSQRPPSYVRGVGAAWIEAARFLEESEPGA